MKQYLRIGCIVRAHGVRGDVKLEPTTDRVERYRGLSHAFLEQKGSYTEVKLSNVRLMNDAVVLHIAGTDTVDAANLLRGAFLCVDRAHAVKLPEHTYFISDLIGLTASDTEGRVYGKITEVYEYPANDVYVIDDGKLMVPALKKVLHEVAPEEGRIVFDAEVLKEVGLVAD
ncbi:MAG: ribosome maturation factor RimM [Clostridia bacterium]|nr:ribosome maturation factor RimM [Clostridia bacterium]